MWIYVTSEVTLWLLRLVKLRGEMDCCYMIDGWMKEVRLDFGGLCVELACWDLIFWSDSIYCSRSFILCLRSSVSF